MRFRLLTVALVAVFLSGGRWSDGGNPPEVGVALRRHCAGPFRSVSRGARSLGLAPRPHSLAPLEVSKDFRERAADLWRAPFDEKAFQVTRSEPAYDMGAQSEEWVRVTYHGEELGDFIVRVNGETMRFGVEVKTDFRGTGLYQSMLARALKDNPRTRFIPARMEYAPSDNARAFVDAVFPTVADFRAVTAKGVSAAELAKLRGRCLAAMYETPAMKARERNGFGRLRKLILKPSGLEMSFVVEKGKRGADDEVEFYLDEGPLPTAISPSGAARLVPSSARSLGAYPEFK